MNNYFKFCFYFFLVVASANAGNRVVFTENKGQLVDESGKLRNDILYTAESKGVKLYFFNNTVSFLFSEVKLKEHSKCQIPDKRKMEDKIESAKYYRMDMEFVNANTNCTVIGEDYTSDYVNYYYAHCTNGITNVRNSKKIIYHNLYTNIDVVYYGIEDGSIKYDIIVKPGGNPNDVQLKYNGASDVSISKNGVLEIKNPLGTIIEQAPFTYQLGNKKKEIETHFKIENNTVRFKVANYDASQTLVIDPWATYYGGSNFDQSWSISTDKHFNIVFTGWTRSIDFPINVGCFQPSSNSNNGNDGDAFIVKLNSEGQRIWATYYGGTADEAGKAIATDKFDNIFVTGYTSSTNFPASIGAFQQAIDGNYDSFILKFDSLGNRLWATYYGGLSIDDGYGITCDGRNNVIVVGSTSSPNFPISNGAFQTVNPGYPAFVIKMDGNGSRLWATYYGGHSGEKAFCVATDNSNNIFFTGWTISKTFPTTIGAFQTVLKGYDDAFLVKLDSSGNQLYSTYYGGTNSEWACGIDIDASNNVVISGGTASPDFPVTNDAYQNTFGGISDEFVAKFTNNGQRIWSTYVGGTGSEDTDFGNALAIDGYDRIVFTGGTYGTDYPVTQNALQKELIGTENVIVTLLNKNGKLICSTYYGCDHEEWSTIAIGKDNTILVSASTGCETLPVSDSAFQRIYGGGGYDAFILNFVCDTDEDDPPIIIKGDTCIKELNIPNIFTPNNDKENNTFEIPVNCINKYQITIYNRWGLKVFETTYANEYWDGTLMNKGKETPEGTYYYILNITDNKDVAALYKGFLTLLR